jgi:cytochrome b561
MNARIRYTRTAVVLHWLIALGIVVNVILGLSAGSLRDAWARPVIDTHKSIGITVLGLALLRLLWRSAHRPPALPAGYRPWERRLSHAVHAPLYLLNFALPLSGWMHDSAWKDAATHPMRLFGLAPWPRIAWITALDAPTKAHLHKLFGAWHEAFAYVLYLLLGLHIAGALKHQFIDREPELQRMSL